MGQLPAPIAANAAEMLDQGNWPEAAFSEQ
jgi:hypothetical protein